MRSRQFRRLPRRTPRSQAPSLPRLMVRLAMCVALALGGGWALAAPDREPPRNSFAPQPGMSIDQANRLLRGQIDGRAVAVVPVEGGRRGYRVRVLLDGGRIVTIRMDRSGRILGSPNQLPFH